MSQHDGTVWQHIRKAPNPSKVFLGAIPEATELLTRRWDHIFYTGRGPRGLNDRSPRSPGPRPIFQGCFSK